MLEKKSLSVVLHQSRETKNTVRYDSSETDDAAPVDSLYLKKFVLNGLRPERIEVVISFE